METNNPVEGMSYADYASLSETDRKRLWSSGQRREAAIEKARKGTEPVKSRDARLLAQVEKRIEVLRSKGINNVGVLERERDGILKRIAAEAELESRLNSESGTLTQRTFAEYREFIKQHGSVDDVVEFDAVVDAYWQTGGNGEPESDEWGKVASQYARLRVQVEDAAEAAAAAAQADADMAQRVADAKQADANQLKPQNENVN